MTTASVRTGNASPAEMSASALRPVAHWESRVDESGRARLSMVWRVPQWENIAAVADSTSAY
jgi:hypothetical protein